jgi:radical SAM/Cys-rich protein
MTPLPLLTNQFDDVLAAHNLTLRRTKARVLQLNIGKKCNQTCAHCHVNAGPSRTEVMSRDTIDRALEWLQQSDIETVDITGGAPELNPHFRYLVEQIRDTKTRNRVQRRVMDRCNLTVLFEPGQDDLAAFLAQHEVEVVASLPCYNFENVELQRGVGVFDKSIRALQLLNSLGYGRDPKLLLHLVYNPVGAMLPGAQQELEAAYKRELQQHFGIVFNNLYALANVPIARFANWLKLQKQWDEYSNLLVESFNPHAVDGLMCRDTINVGWRGEVYDCDFNGMLGMQWRNDEQKPLFLWDVSPEATEQRTVATAQHCFACTAGAGSSCGGATT